MNFAKSNGWKKIFFTNFNQVDPNHGSYDNNQWIEKQKHRVLNFKDEIEISSERNKTLIDFCQKIQKSSLKILDFGGGFGLTYLPLREKSIKTLDYHIVEVPGVAESASRFFENHNELKFHSEIPISLENLDIAHIRTSLQYVEDWKKTLGDLARLNPDYLVLSHLNACENPTYLSIQSWGDHEIPHWFINKSEIVNFIIGLNFDLIADEPVEIDRNDPSWDSHREFPENLQMKYLQNLVFERKK